jgi:hypothetical protein
VIFLELQQIVENKCNDITEILLKVVLYTITLTLTPCRIAWVVRLGKNLFYLPDLHSLPRTTHAILQGVRVRVMVYNTTFNNISVISLHSV